MLDKDIGLAEFVLAVDKRMDIAEGTIPNLCQSLCRLLCQSLVPVLDPILFHIQVSDSCILGQDSPHSSQQLFRSWAPNPKVLFYLLVAFSLTSIFVFMHIFNIVIVHRNI
jgi:hypothetical protein